MRLAEQYILAGSLRFQMSRVHARRIVAGVVDDAAERHFTFGRNECENVSADLAAIIKRAVPAPAVATHP
jgi:hypothetical protein